VGLSLALVVFVLVVIAIVNVQRGGGGPPSPSAGSGSEAPSPTATEPPVAVDAVSTSSDDLTPMVPIDAVPIDATDGTEPDFVVDMEATEQEIVGFGAAMTHSSAQVISEMPAGARAELLRELFAPDGPVRLSVLRVPIGSSDFTPVDAFTFDDVRRGETDYGLERFDLASDRAAMIPMLQEIVELNPELRLIASPWSPPAWLKTTGTLEGGRLLDEASAYETYSAYLVRFVEDYAAAGLDIDFLTVQNEPQLRYPDGYAGTDLPVWQAARLIETLGPALAEAGLETQILGFDHNWELNPSDAETTPEGEDPAYQYPADLLRTEANQWLAGTAFHCYYGSADAMSRLWEEFPDKLIMVTECSGSRSPDDAPEQAFADTLAWQATNLLIPSLRNHASAVLTWNLALDESNGPHRGGCETCSGVVTVSPDGSLTRNAEYAILGQASRFVPPGSVRVDSTGPDGLAQVAFRTPDERTVLIVWNPADVAAAVTMGDGTTALRADLPARSLSTVSWW
jgi:glucosylceramidase